jgi:hypothetical protein
MGTGGGVESQFLSSQGLSKRDSSRKNRVMENSTTAPGPGAQHHRWRGAASPRPEWPGFLWGAWRVCRHRLVVAEGHQWGRSRNVVGVGMLLLAEGEDGVDVGGTAGWEVGGGYGHQD